MKALGTVRDLRNHFPKVRKLVESEGEVLLTERGKPRYRLVLYSPPQNARSTRIDYWARLDGYHTEGLTEDQGRALHEENRGER